MKKEEKDFKRFPILIVPLTSIQLKFSNYWKNLVLIKFSFVSSIFCLIEYSLIWDLRKHMIKMQFSLIFLAFLAFKLIAHLKLATTLNEI